MSDQDPTTILYSEVPKTPVEHLAYRLAVNRLCDGNREMQEKVMAVCRQDVLYFINVFGFLFEPRAKKFNAASGNTIIPFNTWPHQDKAIHKLVASLGVGDVGIDKARGEGATWICLMILLHGWIFEPHPQAYGLVSRNEMAVDNPDDPDSLMSKLDWEMTMLPRWMVGLPKKHWLRNFTKHTIKNLRTGSTFTGYPATGDLTSGGRKTIILMDEFGKFPRGADYDALGATEPVTECRWFVSTYNGADGAYYDVMRENSRMTKIIMDWKDNPTRNKGLYQVVGDVPVAIDPVNNPLPAGYEAEFAKIKRRLEDRGFDLKSGVRSPWYDSRCLRPRMTPQSVAQEYDRDPGGSANRFFTISVVERLQTQTTRKPHQQGDINFDIGDWKARFTPHPEGRLKLWLNLDLRHVPPVDDYVIGADVATGSGTSFASNSALSVARRATGVKVAEFASPAISPQSFADYAVALCHWFVNSGGSPGFMIWEVNGCGGQFRDRLFEIGFRNFYFRERLDVITRETLRQPGWHSNNARKRDLLGHYNWALAEGMFTNPSHEALEECKFYIDTGMKIEHTAALDVRHPTEFGESHGDRVIADALVAWAIKDYFAKPNEQPKKSNSLHPPIGTFAFRQWQHKQTQRVKETLW